MRIIMTRDSLARQVESQKSDRILLEGVVVNDDELRDEMEKRFPMLKRLLPYTTLRIFRELYYARGSKVRQVALYAILTKRDFHSSKERNNTIAVHMTAIRKRLVKERLPFKIVTHYKDGGYSLQEIRYGKS